MAKSTKLEKLRREKNIFRWITKGLQNEDILANIVDNFNVSERQAYKLLKGVYNSIYDNFKADIEEHKAKHMARLEALYVLAMDVKDINQARLVMNDIAKFLGTNAPTKLEHTGKDGGPIESETTLKQGAILPDQALLDEITKIHERFSNDGTTSTDQTGTSPDGVDTEE